MAWTADAPAAGRLSAARVARQTFGLLKTGFGPDVLLTIVVMIVPAALTAWRAARLAQVRAAGGLQGSPAAVFAQFVGPGFWFSILLTFACAAFLYAALSWGTVERVQGRTPRLADKLRAGLRALPSLIGIVVLGYFALVLASLCLLVPGIFLAICWSLVAPVVAVEKRGVFGGFGRSFELTRGNRWSLFLILLVYAVGAFLVALLVAALVRMVFGLGGGLLPTTAATGPALWVGFVINTAVGAVLRVVAATGLGVIYSDLRSLRGGFDDRRLADVFA